MSDFSVVCVDMFQTLVDVNSRRYLFWQKILSDAYSERLAEEYSIIWLDIFTKYYGDVMSQSSIFKNFRAIAEFCFDRAFTQIGLAYDPEQAAQIWINEHRLAPPYEDTDHFLESVRAKLPLCLVSDADDEMILPHLQNYEFDEVFVSERHKSYKNGPEGKLFRAVINHYATEPASIIHIGDGYSDIKGANQAGIKTCWLNRNGIEWSYDLRPNYEVGSLYEAVSVLDLHSGSPVR
ncbi:MAG: HAD family hydrolase [Deltaproteobacteria bacterium]|nr:HAD family hydrolase [Deltaproteobacteria bacterium]MBW2142247.1 HAD family hydrolase [Deltaproteobacteria bacterium]MBW2324630.1 HAD family hydrolase [Deltaproteobacteria bacterium]